VPTVRRSALRPVDAERRASHEVVEGAGDHADGEGDVFGFADPADRLAQDILDGKVAADRRIVTALLPGERLEPVFERFWFPDLFLWP
jgi:hypothetical protein